MTLLPFIQLKQRGNHVPVDQGITSASEEDIVADIMGQHDQFVSSMHSRLAKLQVVRRYWERNDIKNSISSIEKMADNAVSNFCLFPFKSMYIKTPRKHFPLLIISFGTGNCGCTTYSKRET
jgi:hypothetical protein